MIFYPRRLLPLLGSMLVDDDGRQRWEAKATIAALGFVALVVVVALQVL